MTERNLVDEVKAAIDSIDTDPTQICCSAQPIGQMGARKSSEESLAKDPTEVGGIEKAKRAARRSPASVSQPRASARTGRRRCGGAFRSPRGFAGTLVRTACTQLDAPRSLRPRTFPVPRLSLGVTARARSALHGTPASTRCRAGSGRCACRRSMLQGPCRTAR